MAHLASVGSHAINGVAALHTELLKETVLRDFSRVAPEKFVNVTNGVTPRRWIALSNPRLSALITRRIGRPLDLRPGRRSSSGSSRSPPTAASSATWRAVKAANKRGSPR